MSYLEEAADILRSALKSAEGRYNNAPYPRVPEDHRDLLDARVRIAEGFARLHAAERANVAAAVSRLEDEDDYWRDYDYTCSACGARIGIFTGQSGWHHYRGEGTAASPVELYDAGHEAVLAQVTESSGG